MDRPSFRTSINIPKHIALEAKNGFLFIGSCFAEEIYFRMKNSGLKSVSNPAGILFNPSSIGNILRRLIDNEPFVSEDISAIDNSFISWNHHGKFKSRDKNSLLNEMNQGFNDSTALFHNNNCLIITWGSSITYRLRESAKIVANCHKQSGFLFKRAMLNPEEIVREYKMLFSDIIKKYPEIKIILTVSPVRYAKDGFIENQLSKSILFVALNDLLKIFPDHLSYFPAYEIMMDELRDYRFYKKDMIHPSEEAVDLIWDLFLDTYFNDADVTLVSEVKKLRAMEAHRPLFPESVEYEEFKSKLLAKKEQLRQKYPYLNI